MIEREMVFCLWHSLLQEMSRLIVQNNALFLAGALTLVPPAPPLLYFTEVIMVEFLHVILIRF